MGLTVGVFADVVLLHLRGHGLAVLRRHAAQEVHVVLGVEARQLVRGRQVGPVALHLAVQTVPHDQVVRQLHAVRLHGMAGAIVVVPDVRCRAGDDCQTMLLCQATRNE